MTAKAQRETVTPKMSFESTTILAAASLFSVKGLVALVTGGGTGTLKLIEATLRISF